MRDALRIATRRSPLALWQAQHVAERLRIAHPGVATELVPMSTRGDKILDRSLAKVGGKGLFIKELEVALLEDRADLAVHSMKDMPAHMTESLCITALLERANPFDALVCPAHRNIADLPQRARVGTSSLRRSSQLLGSRPDFEIVALRGNVQTRLAKLDKGDCDAILLAVAGLERLNLRERIAAELSAEESLPAIGQGVIGVQCRADDAWVRDCLQSLHSPTSAVAVAAERALGARLGGNCQSPIAGFARCDENGWVLHARVLSADGRKRVVGHARFAPEDADRTGIALAEQLLADGAGEILADIESLA